jgi:dTDP-4-amino-4,6-dideoxygalactose transaminase
VSVPFLDLGAQDAAVGDEIRAAIAEVLGSRQFILGPHVEGFEAAMAAYCGVRHAIGVASGTDALLLALAALGAGPGRAVVTTPFTFFSTASTILRLGARPIFADVDPATLNLDPAAVVAAVDGARGDEVVGVVPVHLFGRLAAMPALRALAAGRGLWILEDAAQALGARADGVRAGAFGRAAALSFYPTKNLGALGDGGMVVTSDDEVAARIRQERHQGQVAPYVHGSLGLCSRLDALQAAALGAKLRHLDDWNTRRRAVAGWYQTLLADARLTGGPEGPIVAPPPAGESHVFHQYVVRARDRDGLRAHLAAAGIGTMVYYPRPVHLQPALASLGLREGAFPEAERAAREVLALPIYPELTRPQVETIVDAIARFYRART